METRANNVWVGAVTLALLAVVVAFIVWIARLGQGDRHEYDIFFKQSVDGLSKGSAVNFSGVPVGQVKTIELWKKDPSFVRVRIAVEPDVPILVGTTATIQGSFTGVSNLQLEGAMKGAPPIECPKDNPRAGCPEGVPVIPTKRGGLGELLNSAPQLLERLSTLTERLTELLNDKNQQNVAGILKNVNDLTGALAARGPEIASAIAETLMPSPASLPRTEYNVIASERSSQRPSRSPKSYFGSGICGCCAERSRTRAERWKVARCNSMQPADQLCSVTIRREGLQSQLGGFSRRATRSSRALSISRVRRSTCAWISNSSRVTRSSLAKKPDIRARAFFSISAAGLAAMRVLRRLLNSSNTLGSSMASVFRKTGVFDASSLAQRTRTTPRRCLGGLRHRLGAMLNFRAPAMCADGP